MDCTMYPLQMCNAIIVSTCVNLHRCPHGPAGGCFLPSKSNLLSVCSSFSPSPWLSPRQPPTCFQSPEMCLFWSFQTDGVLQRVAFRTWLHPLLQGFAGLVHGSARACQLRDVPASHLGTCCLLFLHPPLCPYYGHCCWDCGCAGICVATCFYSYGVKSEGSNCWVAWYICAPHFKKLPDRLPQRLCHTPCPPAAAEGARLSVSLPFRSSCVASMRLF